MTAISDREERLVQLATVGTIRGAVDFGIIAVRPDEYSALLRVFTPEDSVEGRRRYAIASVRDDEGVMHRVALIRSPNQGQSSAQQTAEALIEDLQPHWILVVGIAGAVPDQEFTLGDVILGSRINDFSVQAAVQGSTPEFDFRGSYVHPMVEDFLAYVPALEPKLADWSDSIQLGIPPVSITSDKLYGDPAWQEKVRKSLEYHFPGGKPRKRLFWPGAIATSNTLMKDADLALFLSKFARSVVAFEMEIGGVMLAARRKDRVPGVGNPRNQ